MTIAPTRTARGKVIDLMEALQKSPGRRKDLAKAPNRATEASSKPEKKARAVRREIPSPP